MLLQNHFDVLSCQIVPKSTSVESNESSEFLLSHFFRSWILNFISLERWCQEKDPRNHTQFLETLSILLLLLREVTDDPTE